MTIAPSFIHNALLHGKDFARECIESLAVGEWDLLRTRNNNNYPLVN